jgi:hypothetical protein
MSDLNSDVIAGPHVIEQVLTVPNSTVFICIKQQPPLRTGSTTSPLAAHEISESQNQLQRKGLTQDLFDRRFSVYQSAGEVIDYYTRIGESFDIADESITRFRNAAEYAQFLFPKEVLDFIGEIQTILAKLDFTYLASGLKTISKTDLNADSVVSKKVLELDGLKQKRSEIFRPYLELS